MNKSRWTEKQVWFICCISSKPHLFNFMHQWNDTSCLLQWDSLLPCITQYADAAGHAELFPEGGRPRKSEMVRTFLRWCFYTLSQKLHPPVGPDLLQISSMKGIFAFPTHQVLGAKCLMREIFLFGTKGSLTQSKNIH